MKAERTNQMRSILAEIAKCCESLPPKHKHPIINRCNKVKVIINKMDKDMPTTTIKVSTPEEGKYIAKRAIFNALMAIPNLVALVLLSGVIVKETRKDLWEGNIDQQEEE